MCRSVWIFIWIIVLLTVISHSAKPKLSRSEIHAEGKNLFRALRNSDCKVTCAGKKYRPVCGTDGVTYNHRCDLKRAKRCDRKKVKVKRKGQCPPTNKKSGCFQERDDAVKLARKPTPGVFIPECNKDGTYADVQCHMATGYCWCSSADGSPIGGTSVQGRRPNCRGTKKRKQRGRANKKKNKKRRSCKTADRQNFNKNLIKVFENEYNRAITSGSHLTNNDRNSLEKKIVDWKFKQLDKNNDGILRRKETRTLKRMVRKYIKPKACAKRFLEYCDSDHNKKIKRAEWTMCLFFDRNAASKKSGKKETTPASRGHLVIKPPKRGTESPSGLNPHISATKEPKKEANIKRNCMDERQAALKLRISDPKGGIFIPKCSSDGKWTKEQCHKSKETLCFCVDPNTGYPVKGMPPAKGKITCNFTTTRNIKGCSHAKKRRFLIHLLDTFIAEMNNDSSTSHMTLKTDIASNREKAVRWKFNQLDSNLNMNLDRKEVKLFRKKVPSQKDTRKCSRNFLRYCDENSNRKITLDEWVDCTTIKDNEIIIINPKRKGRNPFKNILRPS